MTSLDDEFDVVVVGAGSAGATLAARLSERSSRRVLLVESGPDRVGTRWPARLMELDRLPAAEDTYVDRVPLQVGHGGRSTDLVAGRVVGGSSAVNGAYFVRPTHSDLDGWVARGNDCWAHELLLPVFCRIESDAEFGGDPWHGDAGPVPVTRRSHPLHPVTEALFAACDAAGHPAQPDLNGGGDPGWGLVPRNADSRGRVSAAMSMLDPARERANLVVRGGCDVRRVVIAQGRVVGVEVGAGDGPTSLVRAETVVLSAGAVGSAALLHRSGIGAADELRSAGRAVVVDAPGVGARGSNHAAIDVMFEPPARVDVDGPLLQGALHLDTPSGAPVEVLATCRPYGRASGDATQDRALSLRVSMMATGTRTRLGFVGGAPTIAADYLGDSAARRALRDAVRAVTELARSPELAVVVGTWLGPDAGTVAHDAELDAWIAARVGTSMHLCSTVPMGPDADPHAVVDQIGRVRGVDGLRVVDTSILPTAPTRGPAYTAMAIAEHLAGTFDR